MSHLKQSGIQHLFRCAIAAQILSYCFASQVYIVYMGSTGSSSPEEIFSQNHEMLRDVHQGSLERAQAAQVYSYKHGFRGFAAKLTADQAATMAKMPGVVSVLPNLKRRLHTTHSWNFMGVRNDEAMEIPGYSTKNQENVIIGFIDTGIWPESPSFNDLNMPPVPPRWKGKCQVGEEFNASSCNRKIIGARYYLSGFDAEEASSINNLQNTDKVVNYISPRDSSGHGSHTASTATGRYVDNINFRGLGSGAARGGAPLARIAVYKACWDSGCYDADILAAFDDAIRDGVHILSMSLGPEFPQGDYFNDAISVGSFHATAHGVLVVSSVGNDGDSGSATNVAPWMITVSASSTDRDFTSDIVLGDGTSYKGESLTRFQMNTSARIMSASDAAAGFFTPYQSSFCLESSLNNTKVQGKVLVCRHSGSSTESKLEKSIIVKEAGGIGMILIDDRDKDVAVPFVIPAAIVGERIGYRILSYVNQTRKPKSLILPAKTVLGSRPAPRVTAFSSKGPSSLTPQILKPDVAAPGLNILAAWSPALDGKKFNIVSGTSMACPHVSGVAALIKSVYPLWSPSAIKSAIMTTATVLDKSRKLITADPEGRIANVFDYGSGFVNPKRVLNPGLVYDAEPVDYKDFLCTLGYDEKSVRLVTGDKSVCNRSSSHGIDLNYPSIAIPNLRDSYMVTRTVTNVGNATSNYRVVVSSPKGVQVTVSPKHLVFVKYGQKLSFTVRFKAVAPTKGYAFGSLTWKKKKLRVTSPLVVRIASSTKSFSR